MFGFLPAMPKNDNKLDFKKNEIKTKPLAYFAPSQFCNEGLQKMEMLFPKKHPFIVIVSLFSNVQSFLIFA